ncbi:MAG: hypothetical protein PHE47_05775 [Oscillospiraceae bacterium]|nr:hypothetical protein [Oscillospiraceae bacterium]
MPWSVYGYGIVADAGQTNKVSSITPTGNATLYAGWSGKTNPSMGFENAFTAILKADWFLRCDVRIPKRIDDRHSWYGL